MRTLNEIEDQIAELQKEKEAILNSPVKYGWRDYEKKFSPIRYDTHLGFIDGLIANGVAFKTPEEARLYDEMMQSALEIRGPEPVDFEGTNDKFYIVWDQLNNRPMCVICQFIQAQGTFYFHTEKQVQTMIDKWGDKLKLWVQGGVR